MMMRIAKTSIGHDDEDRGRRVSDVTRIIGESADTITIIGIDWREQTIEKLKVR